MHPILNRSVEPRSRPRWLVALCATHLLAAILGPLVAYSLYSQRTSDPPILSLETRAPVVETTAAPPPSPPPDVCPETVMRAAFARSTLVEWFRDPMLYARTARVVPFIAHGRPLGFKLHQVRSLSPYALIGLENGDIVRRIAGIDLAVPDRHQVRPVPETVEQITIELTRGGCPILLLVSIV